MPKIYKRHCDNCGEFYIGYGLKYCSVKCVNEQKRYLIVRKDIIDKVVLELRNRGMSIHEMARELNCSRKLISTRLEKYGLKSTFSWGGRKRREITDEMVLKLHACNLSTLEIAQELNCSRKLVQNRLNRHSLKSNGQTRRIKSTREVDKWVEQHQGKHHCICGCGQEIVIRCGHRYEGIPKHRHGHDKRKGGRKATYQRFRKNPKWILNNIIRGGIYRSLKNKGVSKGGVHWETLVSYNREELYNHLLTTIPDGYVEFDIGTGVLHVDHRIPIDAFNFRSSKDEDFQRCWALSNLRLLPAHQNLQKSNKLHKPFQPTLALGVGEEN